MANLSDLRSRIDSAVAALDAEDWPLCLRHARAARLLLLAIPDSTFKDNELRLDRSSAEATIRDLISAAAAAQATAAGGIVTQEITYRRG